MPFPSFTMTPLWILQNDHRCLLLSSAHWTISSHLPQDPEPDLLHDFTCPSSSCPPPYVPPPFPVVSPSQAPPLDPLPPPSSLPPSTFQQPAASDLPSPLAPLPSPFGGAVSSPPSSAPADSPPIGSPQMDQLLQEIKQSLLKADQCLITPTTPF